MNRNTTIAAINVISADVISEFNLTTSVLPPLRPVVSIAPSPSSTNATRSILSAGQALDVANMTIDAMREARNTFQAPGTVHLFLAVPIGVAIMIGQLLNTFAAVQTYEHVPGAPIPYQKAALLSPSIWPDASFAIRDDPAILAMALC